MFRPVFPLVLAEETVRFDRIDAHITQRRVAVKTAITPAGLRLAGSIVSGNGHAAQHRTQAFSEQLHRALLVTYAFGYREAAAELDRLAPAVLAANFYPPPPRPPMSKEAVDAWLHSISDLAAQDYANRLRQLAADPPGPVRNRLLFLADRARREAHNTSLELIGRVLNAGRTAAALARPLVAVWSMRSEQLDKNTCAACGSLHGQTARVGSPEYYALMPPADCFGDGRCRGVYVYSVLQSGFGRFDPTAAARDRDAHQRSQAALKGWRTRRRNIRVARRGLDRTA